MKRFFRVKTVDEVLELINGFTPLEPETVGLSEALNRVTATDVRAGEDVPGFSRSTMDGYAVRARDTFGASEGMPALFELAGEVLMGHEPTVAVGPGQTARIWTGGMMPAGADAVVMLEYGRPVDGSTVELSRPVAPLENVIEAGEDAARGDVLIPRGRRLRPQELGLLAALGMDRVSVARRPKVAIISTGDEIVPVDQPLKPGQVRDVNTYTLSALVESYQAEPIRVGLVRDNRDQLRKAAARGLAEADVVMLSGGSSVGVRDFTVEVFESFPGSELLVHGVAVSPGKPMIMARLGNQSLWGLPGHTVSSMVAFDVFVRPLLARLSGENQAPSPGRVIRAMLARNVPSVHGRQDYVRVRLERNGAGWVAHPVLGKSGLISTMVRADGLVAVGLNKEGLPGGTEVDVQLF